MPEILTLCAAMPQRMVAAGEAILREGERSGMIYILAEGSVEILKGDVQVNTAAEPGAIFGEMSVLLDAPHMATVKTLEASRFYVAEDAAGFLQSDPAIALAVARLLAKRLNAMISYLVDLKHQFEDHDSHLGIVDEVLESLVHHQGEEHAPGSDRDPDPTVY
jgi:CRP/FNR family transcriptional regulator, cyclic AMP receptor protein